MRTYRLVLYRNIQSHWHYVRLTGTEDGQLRTEKGQCGYPPGELETLQLESGTDPEAIVRKAGEVWQVMGYGPAGIARFPVMTLHFKMPRWKGLLPAAPWFDDWVRFYADPIKEAFESTGNGILKNEERFSGNILLYYTVFNPALARQAVALVAAASPEQFDLEISIDDNGKTVSIPIDPEVPQFLQEFLRGFESTARVISSGLSSVSLTDPLQPELQENYYGARITGEEARMLFRQLKSSWRFEYAIWDPARSGLHHESAFFKDWQSATLHPFWLQEIREIAIPDIYFLDFEKGLFTTTPEALFDGVWEGLVFDRTFEWFLYSTDYYTLSLGGSRLSAAVRSIAVPPQPKGAR